MAIKRLSAVDTGGSYEFTVWLDDLKTIPDPGAVLTLSGDPEQAQALINASGAELLAAEGRTFTLLTDAARRIPDPAVVRTYRFGKVDGEGKPLTPEAAWGFAREEALTHAGHAATRGQELVLPDDPESAGDRTAASLPRKADL